MAHLDLYAINRSIEEMLREGRFENRKLSFDEVEGHVKRGHVTIAMIDLSELYDTGGVYQGHAVTLTYVNETHVLFHNSLGTRNENASRERFIKAWNSPGTDNELIIVRGLNTIGSQTL